jgi:hypothetical protein
MPVNHRRGKRKIHKSYAADIKKWANTMWQNALAVGEQNEPGDKKAGF